MKTLLLILLTTVCTQAQTYLRSNTFCGEVDLIMAVTDSTVSIISKPITLELKIITKNVDKYSAWLTVEKVSKEAYMIVRVSNDFGGDGILLKSLNNEYFITNQKMCD